MSFIDTLLSLLGRKKKNIAVNDFISQREMENLATANAQPQKGGDSRYHSVSPEELTPLEGHPGQFTNGQGKGGHDPATGNSFGTYPVYDANGNFLGENATLTVRGQETHFGYSYGTPIPSNVDLNKPGMTQAEALQSAGLDFAHPGVQAAPADVAAPQPASKVMTQAEALQSAGLDFARGGAQAAPGSTYIVGGEVVNPSAPQPWVQHSKEDQPIPNDSTSNATNFDAAPMSQRQMENLASQNVQKAPTGAPAMSHRQMENLAAQNASYSQQSYQHSKEDQPMSGHDALRSAGLDFDNHGINASTPAPAQSTAVNSSGGGAYDFAGQTENPVEGMGGDPTVGGGDSSNYSNYAV